MPQGAPFRARAAACTPLSRIKAYIVSAVGKTNNCATSQGHKVHVSTHMHAPCMKAGQGLFKCLLSLLVQRVLYGLGGPLVATLVTAVHSLHTDMGACYRASVKLSKCT